MSVPPHNPDPALNPNDGFSCAGVPPTISGSVSNLVEFVWLPALFLTLLSAVRNIVLAITHDSRFNCRRFNAFTWLGSVGLTCWKVKGKSRSSDEPRSCFTKSVCTDGTNNSMAKATPAVLTEWHQRCCIPKHQTTTEGTREMNEL
jgi:hypothetical protein